MDKVCCCVEKETPTVALNVTCACCKGMVDEHNVKDSPDLDTNEMENETEKLFEMLEEMDMMEIDDEEQTSCCFKTRPKRHAKQKRDKNTSPLKDGREA